MRDFLSFMAIFVTATSTTLVGFHWFVPLIGVAVLSATSKRWQYVPLLRERGILEGALSLYLQAFANDAAAIGAAVLLGLGTAWMFHF